MWRSYGCCLIITRKYPRFFNSLLLTTKTHSSHKVIRPTPVQPSLTEEQIFDYAKSDASHFSHQIRESLRLVRNSQLRELCHYHFDDGGKLIRPLLITLFAASANTSSLVTSTTSLSSSCSSSSSSSHQPNPFNIHDSQHKLPKLPPLQRSLDGYVNSSQHVVSVIAEMIHTASLVMDDVIDLADTRRGKSSAHVAFGQNQAVLAADYIWFTASRLLAQLGEPRVVRILATIIEDLIKGELMQLVPLHIDDSKRYQHYLDKTFRKTASLIANSCKSAAMLAFDWTQRDSSDCHQLMENGFSFGYHVGMTFQLLDDVLDFEQNSIALGKPASGADLKLGVSTAPVLFALEKFPHLMEILVRKCSQPGDLEKVYLHIEKADGLAQTRMLADFHLQEALNVLELFPDTPFKECLRHYIVRLYNRQK